MTTSDDEENGDNNDVGDPLTIPDEVLEEVADDGVASLAAMLRDGVVDGRRREYLQHPHRHGDGCGAVHDALQVPAGGG